MTKINCPKCKSNIVARYGENRWVKWIDLNCNCGFMHRMKEEELDAIQPTSPLFQLVYNSNPFDEYDKALDNRNKEEEKRKEKLDYKYDKIFRKKEDRKFVKDKVLEGK